MPRRKKSPGKETGLGNRERLKVLNDTNLIPKWGLLMFISDQFGIIQNLQTSLIPQTSFLSWIFFAASYSKIALAKLLALFKLWH